MPFDSNGVFSRVMNWTSDQQNGIAIECGRHDAEDNNFAEGFNDCFCRDGRAAATGNFNLGNHKIQNLADGTATTDAVTKGQMDTALSAKQATIIGGASTIASSNLTASRALVSSSSGKVAVSAVTATELGYLSGVTSNIQTSVVHLSGTETITGAKTFTSDVSIANDNPYIELHDNDFVKGNIPSNEPVYSIYIQDKTSGFSQENRLGIFTTHVQQTSGTVVTFMTAYKNVANSTDNASIRVYYPTSGSPYTYAPTPTDTTTTSGTQIATTGWVNTVGNNVVHKTGNETISGTKTFTSSPVVSMNTPVMALQSKTAVKGTTPSSTIDEVVAFFDKNGTAQSNKLGQVFCSYTGGTGTVAGNIHLGLGVFKPQSGSTVTDYLSIYYPSSGNPYATAPASDVNGSILTTVNKSKSSNGYFQLGNGLIIQWGSSSTTTNTVITFPKAFTSTNYKISLCMNTGGAAEANNTFKDKKTTSFTLMYGYSCDWIAIGY